VFYGELSPSGASVYARLPRPQDGATWKLTGTIVGPRCLNARTLPATAYFCDLGAGPTVLSRATVLDPAYWSADLPSIYDLTIDLRVGDQVVATARRELGFKPLGVRGRNLAMQAKPWVLRGVCAASASEELPRHWHAASAAFVGDQIDARLAEASQRGAFAVVELRGTPDEILARLKHVAMFPAAIMAVVHGPMPRNFGVHGVAPNVLLAQPLDAVREFSPQAWANCVWAETDDARQLARLLAREQPVIAVRRLAEPVPVERARKACDELQRDFATIGQFAGYVV
jgi:glycosyl hydrolase family 2